MTWDQHYHKLDTLYWGHDDKYTAQMTATNAVPQWYFAIVIMATLFGIVGAVFLGAWLNGSKWLNKKNPRIEGKPYERTLLQKFVYRFSFVLMGLFLFMLRWANLWNDNWDAATNQGKGPTNWGEYFGIAFNFWRDPGTYMFQCAIAALFILPWLMIFNRTKIIAVVAPFTFLAATTTVFSSEDLMATSNMNGFEIHRKAIMHILLMVLPVYCMVSARIQFTTKFLAGSIIYMIILNFFVAVTTQGVLETTTKKPDGTYDFWGQGEFGRVATMLGLGDMVTGNYWGFIVLVGFITSLLVILWWFIYNMIFAISSFELAKPSKDVWYVAIWKNLLDKTRFGTTKWFKEFLKVEKASWIDLYKNNKFAK